MEMLLNTALMHVQTFDWQGPYTFLFLVLAILAIFGRWGIIFTTLITLLLGKIAHDLIVMDLQTSQAIIEVPLVIYCVGGILIGLAVLVRFIRFMIL